MMPRFIVPAIACVLGLAGASVMADGPAGQVVASPRPPATQDLVNRVDAYLARWHEVGQLDGVVLVAEGERVVYEKWCVA
jgi:hypothetical protein